MDSRITLNIPASTSSCQNNTFNSTDCCISKQTGGGGIKPVSHSNLTHFVYSYIFLILLSAPLIFCIFREDFSVKPVYEVRERRTLANAPDFATTPLSDLPKHLDSYFKDRMPFRQFFLPGYIYTYENILQTYVSEYVTGYANELFMNHAAYVVDAALGIRPLPLPVKEHIRLTAAGKHAYFLSKGIRYYLFSAPDKSTLYPEWLPFYANWINHRTWYSDQIETLKNANIRFFPLYDFLRQFKDNERLYDIKYDNEHWNGNALAHAYDHMAGILAKDNSIFRPVKYSEYYALQDVPVTWSVYGSEKTKFIGLRHNNDFNCSILPVQYRTDNYNKLCINKTIPKGGLWFFSDSYFGATHGSWGVTPFVHNVHTYIHRHCNMGSKAFTQLADETLKISWPDAVIEEFAERVAGPQHSAYDSKLRLLGDFWMKTQGIFLEDKTDFSSYILHNIDHHDSYSNEFAFKAGNKLTLKAPAIADDLGRVVVMGKLNVSANGLVRILYKDSETNTEKHQDFKIWKGSYIYHQTIHLKPFSKVQLSLQFLTPGRYSFGKIQEIDDLREIM